MRRIVDGARLPEPPDLDPLRSQACAWEAVFAELMRVTPGFTMYGKTGQEAAVQAIRHMASEHKQRGFKLAGLRTENAELRADRDKLRRKKSSPSTPTPAARVCRS